MLSGESAAGKYPVEALRIMGEIAEETENHIDYIGQFRTREFVIRTRVDARYNDAMAAASNASKGVLESLTTAGANKVLELMASKETGTVEVQKKDGTTATVECKDGQCSLCTDCTVKQ